MTRVELRRSRRVRRRVLGGVLILLVVLVAWATWVGVRALLARDDLEALLAVADTAQSQVAAGDLEGAADSIDIAADHAVSARDLTADPLSLAARSVPLLGPNLAALGGLAESAALLADGALRPLVPVLATVTPASLQPVDGAIDLAPLQAAAPVLAQARVPSAEAVATIDSVERAGTIGAVADAVGRASVAVHRVDAVVQTLANTTELAPAMLGADGPRRYLLMVQNNAEVRATGGLPGALAVLETDAGRIRLGQQASAESLSNTAAPVLPLDASEQNLFGARFGTYMQNVNLTPDFPRASRLALEHWRIDFGVQLDGVIAIDPVTLSYVLEATGPIPLATGETLTSDTVVDLLLRGVYDRHEDPAVQDAVFADVARTVFSAVTAGGLDPASFVDALTRAGAERRILIYNVDATEQAALAGTTLSGTLHDDDRTLGIYLNDLGGTKLDSYLTAVATVGAVDCAGTGSWNAAVQLASSVPADAAESLPPRVAQSGYLDLPAGIIATQVLVYGPPGAIATTVTLDGVAVSSQPVQRDDVAIVAVRVDLAPGADARLEVAFTAPEPPSAEPVLLLTPLISAQPVENTRVTCP